MWDEANSFYYDHFKDGTLSDVKTIGAYWALLADIVPKERISAFIEHLRNPNEFNRPHRIPSLSADLIPILLLINFRRSNEITCIMSLILMGFRSQVY